MHKPVALWLLVLLLLSGVPVSQAQAPVYDGRPDQVALDPAVRAPGSQLSDLGYLSPVTAAPRRFSHVVVRQDALVPPGAVLLLALRVSQDGTSWSDWLPLVMDNDLWMPIDGPDVAWSAITDVGGVFGFWQLQASFQPAANGDLPMIRGFQVSSVDATRFPPPKTGLASQPASAPAAIEKPAVVSRTSWGSPDGQGSQATPQYRTVNHLVIHHTATSNTATDWAAQVRSIWSFHTYTRGWGDIGYNYLIDPNGVIYEGRAGGDDVVGFHDKANFGSMGVSLLGNFEKVLPTDGAQDSLVRLLAWKASQKGIDPLGSGSYYGCRFAPECMKANPGAVVLNIAGHRQVLGAQATTCPGNAFFPQLPTIRARVQQLIAGGSAGDNGDLQVDEQEEPNGFLKSSGAGVFWYEANCGTDNHTYYTYATDRLAESTNNGRWTPSLPVAGRYRVYASVPQNCTLPSAPSASPAYQIAHADGLTTVQPPAGHTSPDAWIDLGVYRFDAGANPDLGSVRLTDLTGEPYSNNPAVRRVVFFDSIKFVLDAQLELQDVSLNKTTVAVGETVQVRFTLQNKGSNTLSGQAPQIDLSTIALGIPDDGYLYEQQECFAGSPTGLLPAYPKQTNRVRLTLGYAGWDATFAPNCAAPVDAATGQASTSDNPWRWGLNVDLRPGDTQVITGYVRFQQPGIYPLRANVIQEYVNYFFEPRTIGTVTVISETREPVVGLYSAQLQPMAQVYQLDAIPDNYLTRTIDPTAILRGTPVGAFPWDGQFTNWWFGGPLGTTDRFLIEQSRTFVAPISGTYTFRTISDDGSWLWINGQLVITNAGLRYNNGADQETESLLTSYDTVSTTLQLAAGVHRLSFRFFERGGLAYAGYQVKLPSSETFVTPADGSFGQALVLGTTFVDPPQISLAADDQAGQGQADTLRRFIWSINDGPTEQHDGGLLQLGSFSNGSYRIRYQVEDAAGNRSPEQILEFRVNTAQPVVRTYLGLIAR